MFPWVFFIWLNICLQSFVANSGFFFHLYRAEVINVSKAQQTKSFVVNNTSTCIVTRVLVLYCSVRWVRGNVILRVQIRHHIWSVVACTDQIYLICCGTYDCISICQVIFQHFFMVGRLRQGYMVIMFRNWCELLRRILNNEIKSYKED